MSEEEDMAAAWGAALAEEDGAPVTPDATRVLNQSEIDSLLGFEELRAAARHAGRLQGGGMG